MEQNSGGGSYLEERLWLISRVTTAEKDINEAHTRIRELGKLKDRVLRLEIRAGAIAAGSGALAMILWELAKHYLFH